MNIIDTPISLLIFITTIAISIIAFSRQQFINKLILRPYFVIRQNRWHTIITSGFIHSDWGHLIFNMLTFYFFCFDLERWIGGSKFLIIYFLSMIIADIPSIIKNKNNINYGSLGASGAISGALFSSIILNPSAKLLIFPIPFPIPAPIFAILYLVYCVYLSKNSQDNINHSAHFWGALTGIILTIILVPESINSIVGYFS